VNSNKLSPARLTKLTLGSAGCVINGYWGSEVGHRDADLCSSKVAVSIGDHVFQRNFSNKVTGWGKRDGSIYMSKARRDSQQQQQQQQQQSHRNTSEQTERKAPRRGDRRRGEGNKGKATHRC